MNKENFKEISQVTEVFTFAIVSTHLDIGTAIACELLWLQIKNNIIGVIR